MVSQEIEPQTGQCKIDYITDGHVTHILGVDRSDLNQGKTELQKKEEQGR